MHVLKTLGGGVLLVLAEYLVSQGHGFYGLIVSITFAALVLAEIDWRDAELFRDVSRIMKKENVKHQNQNEINKQITETVRSLLNVDKHLEERVEKLERFATRMVEKEETDE
jgi:hypothetical protein